jgi:hypothetical protein
VGPVIVTSDLLEDLTNNLPSFSVIETETLCTHVSINSKELIDIKPLETK